MNWTGALTICLLYASCVPAQSADLAECTRLHNLYPSIELREYRTLGECYRVGIIPRAKTELAIGVYRDGIEQGDITLKKELGKALFIEGKNYESLKEAVKLMKESQGKEYDPNVGFILGLAYLHGKGVTKDIEVALTNIDQAAIYGNLLSLAFMHSTFKAGLHGTPANEKKADTYKQLFDYSARKYLSSVGDEITLEYAIGFLQVLNALPITEKK